MKSDGDQMPCRICELCPLPPPGASKKRPLDVPAGFKEMTCRGSSQSGGRHNLAQTSLGQQLCHFMLEVS
jgi:hypothetical protein